LRRAYVAIHVDDGSSVKAWLPDFSGLSLAGDRLSDTLTQMPLLLERHAKEMRGRGESLPEPTTPNLWAIHAQYPDALVGFVEVDASGDEAG
jgi:hypothetical protein